MGDKLLRRAMGADAIGVGGSTPIPAVVYALPGARTTHEFTILSAFFTRVLSLMKVQILGWGYPVDRTGHIMTNIIDDAPSL
jgi:hypothetical protein